MAQIQLQVAGIGYDGAPAGKGGPILSATESGSEADKVYYKVSSGGGVAGAIKELFFEQVHEAYLDPNERSTLENLGVIYRSETDVRSAGMSQYVLWEVDGRKNER